MTEEKISQALTTVFHDVFDDRNIIIHRGLTAKGVEGWDSFNHVRLIVTIEECFDISFSTTEIADLRNVGELIDLVSLHLAKQ